MIFGFSGTAQAELPQSMARMLGVSIAEGEATAIATVARTMIKAFPDQESEIRNRLKDTPTAAAQRALASLERTLRTQETPAVFNRTQRSAPSGGSGQPQGFFGLSGWDGQVALNGRVDNGDTQSEAMSAEMKLSRESRRWRHQMTASFDVARAERMTTEEKLLSRYDIDYDMGDRSYALGRVAYRKKRFSAYDYRAISSVGYGYRLVDGPYLGWNLEGGPGYRLNRLEHRPGTDSEVIGRLSSNLEWQLTDFAVFRNTLGVFAGTHTSTLNTTTSLALDVASRLSGEFAVETMTDTNGAGGREKTEITSTARILFQF